MIKKTLFGVAAAVVLSLLVFGRGVWSYVSTAHERIRDSVHEAIVPIEFEIDRARKMVRDLVPDIRQAMHVIAKEEVEVERLEEQIVKQEARIHNDRDEIKQLTTALKEDRGTYYFAGRSYSHDQVKTDLARRFTRYKTTDATLDSTRNMLIARQRNLSAAQKKLEAMLAAKRKLEVDVENLEARLKLVQVAQASSETNIDDSRLARVNELVGEVRGRLAVAEKLANADVRYHDEIQLEADANDDVVEQVTEYFELDRPGVEKVAEASH